MGLRQNFLVGAILLLGCGEDATDGLTTDGDPIGGGEYQPPGDGDGDGSTDWGDGDAVSGDGDAVLWPGDGDGTVGDGDSTAGDGDGGDGDDGGSNPPVPGPGTRPSAAQLPKPSGACPDLKDGSLTVAGSTVRLWVGSKPGPVYFYFHGTGSSATEVLQGLPGSTTGVQAQGGLVASWEKASGNGTSTGGPWAVWYTGDFDAADQILACAIEKGIVDTARIHVAGYSAGGLQAGAMFYLRSNYLASGIVYSGGKGFGANKLQDASNPPSVLFAHGAPGKDVVIIDFAQQSATMSKEIASLGGTAVDCDDGGGHVVLGRLGLGGSAMQFLRDHPYGTRPYGSGLPAGFPQTCKIVP